MDTQRIKVSLYSRKGYHGQPQLPFTITCLSAMEVCSGVNHVMVKCDLTKECMC